MSRFAHVLRQAEVELSLPEPQRSRILLEMAQDLDDLYASYRRAGIGEAEAAARAASMLGISGRAAAALTELHSPWHERLTGRLAARTRGALEVVLLTTFTLSVLASAGIALAQSPRLHDPDAFIVVLLGVLASSAWCAGSVVIRRSSRRDPMRASRALRALPALCAVSLCVGALGAAMDLRTLAATLEGTDFVSVLGRAAELLVFALGIGLLIALVWFQLRRRLAALLRARMALDPWLHSPLTEEDRS